MRTRQHETTEMLEQKKANSKTPVGPTKDRASDYENTPIQIYRKFHLQKLKIFR